jgi:hypothetical protein
MTPEQKRTDSQTLYANLADYWYEVDNHGGHGTSVCFTEDGIFHAGNTAVVGRAAIEEYLLKRVSRGPRTSRHIISNFRAKFDSEASATTHCVLILHAADGTPPLPLTAPVGIFDLIDRWVKTAEGEWLVADRSFRPVFTAQAAAAAQSQQ